VRLLAYSLAVGKQCLFVIGAVVAVGRQCRKSKHIASRSFHIRNIRVEVNCFPIRTISIQGNNGCTHVYTHLDNAIRAITGGVRAGCGKIVTSRSPLAQNA
jgi:hypothetical protein